MPDNSETIYFTGRGLMPRSVYSGELILRDGTDLVVRLGDGRLTITSEECLTSIDAYEECIKEQKCDELISRLSTRATSRRIKMETIDKVLDEIYAIEEKRGGDDG